MQAADSGQWLTGHRLLQFRADTATCQGISLTLIFQLHYSIN